MKLKAWLGHNRRRIELSIDLIVIFGAIVVGAFIFLRLLPVEIGNVIEVENEEQAIIAGKILKDSVIAIVAVVVGCVAACVGFLELSAWLKERRSHWDGTKEKKVE